MFYITDRNEGYYSKFKHWNFKKPWKSIKLTLFYDTFLVYSRRYYYNRLEEEK